jgi:hypothetical protein
MRRRDSVQSGGRCRLCRTALGRRSSPRHCWAQSLVTSASLGCGAARASLCDRVATGRGTVRRRTSGRTAATVQRANIRSDPIGRLQRNRGRGGSWGGETLAGTLAIAVTNTSRRSGPKRSVSVIHVSHVTRAARLCVSNSAACPCGRGPTRRCAVFVSLSPPVPQGHEPVRLEWKGRPFNGGDI